MNILLTVSYDGSAYCGWQFQENGLTVQEVLETALSKYYHSKIRVAGASRTDSGVHALGQRVLFSVANPLCPLDKLPEVINAILPPNVVITAAVKVVDGFQPTRNALKKTYIYNICNSAYPNPLVRNTSAAVRVRLDIEAMQRAAGFFVGTFDFAGFCSAGGSAKTTMRTVFECEIRNSGDMITLKITGNGFLYNMVRIIAGTLIEVGLGKKKAEEISEIIASKERNLAGITAPANGLVLFEVVYDERDFIVTRKTLDRSEVFE